MVNFTRKQPQGAIARCCRVERNLIYADYKARRGTEFFVALSKNKCKHVMIRCFECIVRRLLIILCACRADMCDAEPR